MSKYYTLTALSGLLLVTIGTRWERNSRL